VHEAETYEQEAAEAARRYHKALDEVKGIEQVIVDQQKEIQDSEAKLKQQQTLFENVLNERNLYAKNYLELHSEINEELNE
jgi:hypothetical protein